MKTNSPLRIGHRGAAGHAPENTLLSMRRAIELGVDMVEFDVQRTRDGELVVLHDKRVDRTTLDGRGYISEMSLAEAQRLGMEAGQRIPTLKEVLVAVNGRCGVMVELIQEGLSEQVVACIRECGFSGEIIYASFLHAEMLAVRAVDSSAKTLALFEGVPVDHTAFVREAKVTHAGLAFDSAREGLVHDLQAAGIKVFVYTLNEPEDIERARRWGVDGIISNFPDRLPVREGL